MPSFRDAYKQDPIRDKSWVFPFGKFKGRSLGYVMDEDPGYLSFLQARDICDFHSCIFEEMDESRQELRGERDFNRRDMERAVGSLDDFLRD